MKSRGTWLGGLCLLVSSGCVGAETGAPKPRVHVTLQGTLPPSTTMCIDLDVHPLGADQASTASAGDPATLGETAAAARAEGAICGVSDDLAAFDFRGACDPTKQNEVTLWLGNFEDVNGAPVTDLSSPCASGCRLAFDCPGPEQPDAEVSFNLLLFPNDDWGFFDLELHGEFSGAVRDVCYDVRVSRGDGAVVWTAGDPTQPVATPDDASAQGGLCATRYGFAALTMADPHHGSSNLEFVGPCDARQPAHTLTIWPRLVVFDAIVPVASRTWANPCAAATRGTGPESWDGGCTFTLHCVENDDTAAQVSFDFVAGTRSPE